MRNEIKLAIFFALALLSISVHAQNYLILKNGENIPFAKYAKKSPPGKTHVINSKKQEIKLDSENILANYSALEETLYYRKPSSDSTESGFESVERILEGRINVYKKEVITSVYVYNPYGGSTVGKVSYYYNLEKDGEYKNVLGRGWMEQSNKKKVEIFRSFIYDDERSLKIVEKEGFKLKDDNLIEIIRDYNIRSFKPEENPDKEKSSVGFYTKVKSKFADNLILRVNDSIDYKLPEKYPLLIQLPIKTLSKVCFVSETGSLCDLLSGSQFSIKYYELEFKGNSNSFDITRKTVEDAQKYIRLVNQATYSKPVK